jgi:O-antigen/teichoic acid export membrane protein
MINKSKLVKGSIANLYGLFGVIVIQLLTVPILINNWGAEKYGEWLILFNIPSFLMLIDLGLVSVTTSEITKLISQGKFYEYKIVFLNTFVQILISSFIVIFLISIFLFKLELNFHENFNIKNIEKLNLCLFFICIYYILGIFIELLDGLLRANSFYPTALFISSSVRIFDGIVICIYCYYLTDFLIIAQSLIILKLFAIFYMMLVLKRNKITVKVKNYRFNFNTGLLKKGLNYLILPINNVFNNQILISLIGIFIGPIYAVMINIIKLFLKLSTSLISLISSTIAYDVNRLYYLNKNSELLNILNKSILISLFINISYILIFLFFYNEIINLFIKKDFYVEFVIVIIYSLVILTNNLYQIEINFHTAINKHDLILRKISLNLLFLLIINLLIMQIYKQIYFILIAMLIFELINLYFIKKSFRDLLYDFK